MNCPNCGGDKVVLTSNLVFNRVFLQDKESELESKSKIKSKVKSKPKLKYLHCLSCLSIFNLEYEKFVESTLEK